MEVMNQPAATANSENDPTQPRPVTHPSLWVDTRQELQMVERMALRVELLALYVQNLRDLAQKIPQGEIPAGEIAATRDAALGAVSAVGGRDAALFKNSFRTVEALTYEMNVAHQWLTDSLKNPYQQALADMRVREKAEKERQQRAIDFAESEAKELAAKERARQGIERGRQGY